jgi:hypothetical protein
VVDRRRNSNEDGWMSRNHEVVSAREIDSRRLLHLLDRTKSMRTVERKYSTGYGDVVLDRKRKSQLERNVGEIRVVLCRARW